MSFGEGDGVLVVNRNRSRTGNEQVTLIRCYADCGCLRDDSEFYWRAWMDFGFLRTGHAPTVRKRESPKLGARYDVTRRSLHEVS